MKKYCPENERMKRSYTLFLEAADGKQCATADAALRSIERFEKSTGWAPFKKFHIEQIRKFRADLSEEVGSGGKPLSAATIVATLKQLRNFFLWLSREPGFRSAINANDLAHFKPTDQDTRIATAKRERPVPTVEDIKHVLRIMPTASDIDHRNRALVAFALLSGARDGALASLRLKHIDLEAKSVFQDGRDVRTKRRKTFVSNFFPVGPECEAIFAAYLDLLKQRGFGPDDPLFPATLVGHGPQRGFAVEGLSRSHWTTGAPIRQIFRDAFEAAGLPYSNPHTIRKTLVRLGQRICKTPEEWKCWSQNLGHESEATTFVGYGQVPRHRQAEILAGLGKPNGMALPPGLDIDALEAFVKSAKQAAE